MSQYHSPEALAKAREYNRFRRATRHIGVNCHSRAVKVVDEQMDTPYYISKNEFALYKKAYAAMPGVTVFVDGKPVGIQMEMTL